MVALAGSVTRRRHRGMDHARSFRQPKFDSPRPTPTEAWAILGTYRSSGWLPRLMKTIAPKCLRPEQSLGPPRGSLPTAVHRHKIRDHAGGATSNQRRVDVQRLARPGDGFFSISKSSLAGTAVRDPEFTRNAWAGLLASSDPPECDTFRRCGEAGRGCRRLFRIENRQPVRLGRGRRAGNPAAIPQTL